MADRDVGKLEDDLEAMITGDDGAAVRETLAAGIAVHVRREDTPTGRVVRIHPDGREETIRTDRVAAAKILGD